MERNVPNPKSNIPQVSDEVLHVFQVNKLLEFKQNATLHHLRVPIKNQFHFTQVSCSLLPLLFSLFTQSHSSIQPNIKRAKHSLFFYKQFFFETLHVLIFYILPFCFMGLIKIYEIKAFFFLILSLLSSFSFLLLNGFLFRFFVITVPLIHRRGESCVI